MVDTWILSLEKGSPTGDFCGNLSADRWEVRDIFGYVIQVLACDKKRCCSWNAIYGSSRRARGRADNDIACRWAGDGGKWKRDIGLPWIWMICCQCFVFKNFLPRFLDSSKGLEKTRGHIQISFASTSENSLPRWCNGTWQPQIALVETLFCLGKLAEAWIAPGINETISSCPGIFSSVFYNGEAPRKNLRSIRKFFVLQQTRLTLLPRSYNLIASEARFQRSPEAPESSVVFGRGGLFGFRGIGEFAQGGF